MPRAQLEFYEEGSLRAPPTPAVLCGGQLLGEVLGLLNDSQLLLIGAFTANDCSAGAG